MILCELETFIVATGSILGDIRIAQNAASGETYRASRLGYREKLRYPEAIAAFQISVMLPNTLQGAWARLSLVGLIFCGAIKTRLD